MIAPAVVVYFRRATKFAVHRHQCAIQQPAFLQVIQERTDRPIGRWQQLCFHYVENIVVIVPILTGLLVEVKIHQRVRHAHLRQPPRQERLLSPRMRTIPLPHFQGLATDVKSASYLTARQHLRRTLAVRVQAIRHARYLVYAAQ